MTIACAEPSPPARLPLQSPTPSPAIACQAPATDPARTTSDGWRLISPGGDVDDRRALWAAGADELWAAPSQGGSIERFRAGQVERFSVPGRIYAFWGSAPDDVWAVGETIHHWDGACWTLVLDVPGELRSVWGTSPSAVWAAGLDGVLLRWDGAEWRVQDSDTTNHIASVWASSEHDVWLAEAFNSGSGNLVRRWDGAAWTVMHRGEFLLVWGLGPDDVWLGGNGALQHWDGTRLRLVSQPGLSMNVLGVWGSSPDDLVATTYDGQVLEWDGQSWRVAFEVTDPSLRYSRRLFGIAGADGTRWVSGDAGLVLRRDAHGWTQIQPLGDLRPITSAIAVSADEQWWAQGGDVFHRSPAGVTRETLPADVRVKRLVRTSEGTMWAIDERDRVLRRVDGVWTESLRVEATQLILKLTDIATTSDDNVWVVGYDESNYGGRVPVVRRFDGTSWQALELPREMSTTLLSVLTFGPNDTWIGGENRVAHWDGATLRVERLAEDSNTRNVTGLWGTSSATVFAAASGVWRRDGDGWSLLPGPPGPHVLSPYRVWGRSDDEVYVGGSGRSARWDGAALHWLELPGFVGAMAVFGVGDDTCIAGDFGVLTCRRAGP